MRPGLGGKRNPPPRDGVGSRASAAEHAESRARRPANSLWQKKRRRRPSGAEHGKDH